MFEVKSRSSVDGAARSLDRRPFLPSFLRSLLPSLVRVTNPTNGMRIRIVVVLHSFNSHAVCPSVRWSASLSA